MNIDIRGNVNNGYLDIMARQVFKSKYFINIFTRIPAFGNHLYLDHIFIKTSEPKCNNINVGVIQTQITDYFSAITAIPMSNYDEIILIKSINYNLFNTYLNDENWSFLYYKSYIN